MVATVKSPAAPTAGQANAPTGILAQVAQARAQRASGGATDAGGGNFVAQARALVGDSAVSVGQVDALISQYKTAKASKAPASNAEQRSRESIDREMPKLLDQLRSAAAQGKVSRDEFDTIGKLVVDVKTSPSASNFLKAKAAIQDAGGSALLGAGSGMVQVRKDHLLSEILEHGDFGNANIDGTKFIYNAASNTWAPQVGGQPIAHGTSNTQALYDALKTLDVASVNGVNVGSVDGDEMAEIVDAARHALRQGAGRISNGDLDTLSAMIGVANFRGIEPPPQHPAPTLAPAVLPPPAVNGAGQVATTQVAQPAPAPVAPATQTPITQAVQEVFNQLMRQLGVKPLTANAQGPNALQGGPSVPGQPPTTGQQPAGWRLDTGDVVGPRIDWQQMFGDKVGSNFVVVPSVLDSEARTRLMLGFSNADVAREIWTQFRQQWGDVASTQVTRFGDVPSAVAPNPVVTLPAPPPAPAKTQWSAVDNGNGTGVIDIGTHKIELNEANSQWVVTDKATGKQTRIWGDPHVDYNNDGTTDLDFKGNLNLMLGNTRVHIATVPFGNTGETLSSRLTISDGNQTLVVNGLAQHVGGVDTDGKMSITRVQGEAAAKAFDGTWGHQVVYQGGDGAWHVAAGKLLQGSLKLGADGKERVEFSKVDQTKRLPQFGGQVGDGFTVAQKEQMSMLMQMIAQQMTDMLRRMQQQGGAGGNLAALYGGRAGG